MSDASGDSLPPLASLIALQDADLHVDRLRHQAEHHPARLAQRGIDDERRELERERTRLRGERQAIETRQGGIEDEVASSRARSLLIDERLRSSSGGSFRDQEAMASEVASIEARVRELEDAELELMEEAEPIEAELDRLDERDAMLGEEHARLVSELDDALGEINEALAVAAASRQELANAVPGPLLSEYERLRTQLGGIGAARVLHGACAGCNLALPASEIDAIRRAGSGQTFHCDQCGRILVP